MRSSKADVAVVGGGIVGVATALSVVSAARVSLLLLEAEERLATHQSGRNSGVIHSGLYYRPGSLKARTCVEGQRRLYAFCRQERLAFRRCGKLVVAAAPAEVPALEELLRRGQANGLEDLRRLDPREIEQVEPHARGVAGLWVGETGVVDFAAVTEAMARKVEAAGGEVHTAARVIDVQRSGQALVLETPRGRFEAGCLVNCAGLHCDRLARLCGDEPEISIVPFRGEYYELRPEARFLVRGLIYPVPDPRFPFLGVHFTRALDGRVEAGPNAILAFEREGYRRCDFSWRDSFEMLTSHGFGRLARGHWRMGLREMRRSLSRTAFARDLGRLVPEVRAAHLIRGRSGVRAQAVDRQGGLLDDFHLLQKEQAIHVLNAPSPAATASLAIGRVLADMAIDRFGLARRG